MVQAVLLIGLESWVHSAEMEKTVEGRGAHRVPPPNHREVGAADYEKDVGDTGGGGSAGNKRESS